MSHDDRPPPVDPESVPTQVTPAPSSSQAGLLPLGTRVAGRYLLKDILGTGGMGVVYRARDELLELDLALKILRTDIADSGDFLKRFRNELILARRVSHRHVVSNYDVGEHKGLYFMTMDLIEGRSLEEVLRERGQLPVEEAAKIVRQVAGALLEAHRQGIVHRDLKPANILIDGDGDAYVSDFGIARTLHGAGLTRTGEVLGTPHYLSPEQARGEKVDGRSDLFTLGIIFIQLVSGQVPSKGDTLLEIVAQRMHGRLRSFEELGVAVDRRLRGVLERMIATDPAARYQTAAELLADLDGTASVRPAGVAPWRGRGRALAWAAVVVLAIAGAVVFFARLADRPAPPPGPAEHSVAVLPFPTQEGGERFAWASTGIAEMLGTALAENDRLRVLGSVRVFQLIDDLGFEPSRLMPGEVEQLASLLQVDRLVHGKLAAAGETIEVEMSLMELDLPGTPSRQIDARRGPLRQLFELIDGLEAKLREALEVSSDPRAQAVMTASPEALEAYAEGLYHLSKRATLAAAPALERAVAADPAFIAAWVRLSEAYQSLGRDGDALRAASRAVEASGDRSGRLVYEARAQRALLEGKPEESQAILEELVTSYPNDSEARITLAEAYGLQGKFTEAVAHLEQVVAADPGDAEAWYLLGRFSIQGGDSQRAVEEYLVRALAEQRRLRNEQGEAEVLNALGVGFERLGQIDAARESYASAAEVRRRLDDRRGLATTLGNLALIELSSGDPESAAAYLEEALALHEDLGNRAGMAEIHTLFGALEEEQGRFTEALEEYRRALQLRDDLGDERALAESLANVGFIYYLLGEYDNALLYLERSLGIYRKNEDPRGSMLTLQMIGFCQVAKGQWAKALPTLLDSLEISRDNGERVATSAALGSLGQVAQYQGRYEAALSQYGEALGILAELGDRRGQIEFTLREAEASLGLGVFDVAVARLDRVEAWLEEAGNREQRAFLENLRGRRHLRLGEVDRAAAFFATARADAEASGSAIQSLNARLGAGRAAFAAGRLAAAAKELQAVAEEAERLGHAVLELRSAEALAEVELARGEAARAVEILRRAVRRAADGGDYARSFRLKHLLAEGLRTTGENAAAAELTAAALKELARVRSGLDPELRHYFDELAEVTALLAAP